jgi:HEAT repeat protein
LVKIGTPAVEPLIAAMEDPDKLLRTYPEEQNLALPSANRVSLVRIYAEETLGKIRDPRAVEPLIAALTSPDWSARATAADALGVIRDLRAVRPLIAAFKDPDSGVPPAATRALTQIGAPALESLVAAMEDPDERVRVGAAGVLGGIKDLRAVGPLVAALKDQHYLVRQNAAGALSEIGGPRGVEALIAALEDPGLGDRENVERALIAIGPLAVEPLIAALKSPDNRIQQGAAKTLAKIDDPRAVDALMAELKGRHTAVICSAYQFFINRRESGSEDPLIEALSKAGHQDMATAFLDSGNSRLEKAGENWASEHGYGIRAAPGGPPIRWGKK